jgi:two-component system response regulator PilR (NtrC family)
MLSEKKKQVLVIDDEESIRQVFRWILEGQGYEVETAETGVQAIEKFEEKFYNLALLDIRLPDMEGTELLNILHKRSPKTMKIMVTGYPSLDNAMKSLNVGADAYVVKPVEPSELVRIVQAKLKEQEDAEGMSQETIGLRCGFRSSNKNTKYNKTLAFLIPLSMFRSN